jgi:hypothetical protein
VKAVMSVDMKVLVLLEISLPSPPLTFFFFFFFFKKKLVFWSLCLFFRTAGKS